MKKILLCSFLAIAALSCKKTDHEKNIESTTATSKDTVTAVEKMSISEISAELKNGDYSREFAKYSDEVVQKIAVNMSYSLTMDNRGELEYLKEITNFKNDIISLYWETCATGGCVNYQKLQIKGNEVMDLGNGYDKLTETEAQKLNAEIKTAIKNFSDVSGRNENEISISQNGNYLISVRGLTEEDSEASGGSIKISYETKDLKTYIPSTLKISK